jgi:hypothetical protein
MKQILEFLEIIYNFYKNHGFVVRFVLTSLITLISSNGLGIAAEFGAYRWALYYGLRPPFEGIPYLRISVSIFVIILVISVVVIHVISQAFLRIIIIFLLPGFLYLTAVENSFAFNKEILKNLKDILINKKFDRKKAFRRIKFRFQANFNIFRFNRYKRTLLKFQKVKINHVFIFSLLISILVAVFTYFNTINNLKRDGIQKIQILYFTLKLGPEEVLNFSIFVFFAFFTGIFFIWKPILAVRVSLTLNLILLFILPFAIVLSVDLNSILLRYLGYGGGLPVSISIIEYVVGEKQKINFSGYLMLRTTSSILIYLPEKNQIREIPLTQLLFLDQKADSVARREPKLPLINDEAK